MTFRSITTAAAIALALAGATGVAYAHHGNSYVDPVTGYACGPGQQYSTGDWIMKGYYDEEHVATGGPSFFGATYQEVYDQCVAWAQQG